MSVQCLCKAPEHQGSNLTETKTMWKHLENGLMFYNRNWNCTVTVSLIYIKITADKCIYIKPTISFWFTGTHTIFPKPYPLWQPRRESHQGHFQRDSTAHSHRFPGLWSYEPIPASTTVWVSRFTNQEKQITRASAPSYQLNLIKHPHWRRNGYGCSGERGYTIATQTAESSEGEM